MQEITLPHDHNETEGIALIKSGLANIADFTSVADIFKILGDASRLRIFWLLCHCEECVVNISALMEMTMPAVSHHLRQLKAGGLLTSRRHGKEVYYKAADSEQSRLLHEITEKVMRMACPHSAK